MDFIGYLILAGMGVWILTLRKRVAEVEVTIVRLESLFEPTPQSVVPVVPTPVKEAEAPVQAPVFAAAPTEPAPPSLPVPPSLSERLRDKLGSQEWEMLVGGSLLNKLGALVLVIGIALFLGYSFGHMTATGRAVIALIISAGILATGIRVEHMGAYKVFARGLIGAGWAALYATAYAIYAIPEARIIPNQFVGSLGMIAVAIGMIWHSLRYREQAVTVVAYFATFAAMAVTPSSPFAVIAIVPLAASLLYLAARFEWHTMALFGLLATYLTCISRGSSDASLASTQALFLAYWLMFEAFDLLRMKYRFQAGGLDLLFPLNTVFFLGLSYLTWSSHAPERLWLAASIAAALYLADSIVRAYVRPPSSFAATDDLLTRLRYGSYEGCFVVSAVLAGLGIVARVPGLWTAVGLALEAETVYLAGLRLRSQFLRRLGARSFALSLAPVAWSALFGSQTLILGHWTYNWTPPALLHVFLFWMNRALRRPNAIFSWSAAVIAAMVLEAELPLPFIGAAWILLGLALFEIGLRRQLREFHLQSYFLFAGGVAVACLADWPGLAIGTAALYTAALRSRAMEDRFRFALGASLGVSLLAAMLLSKTMPPEYFGLALCALAVTALELGSHNLPAEMRLCFGPLALAATVLVIESNFKGFVKFPAASVSISYLGACLAATAAAVRLERTTLRDGMVALACAAAMAIIWLTIPDAAVTVLWTVIAIGVLVSFPSVAGVAMVAVYIRTLGFDLEHEPLIMPVAIAGMYWMWRRFRGIEPWDTLIFWSALLPVLCLIAREAGDRNMSLGWVIVSIVLLIVGNRAALPHGRYQSYLVALLAFAAALFFDTQPPRLRVCGTVAAGFYAAQYFARSQEDRRAPAFFSLLGTLLVICLLFERVSGGLLTVSWGMQGLALLGCGFAFRERILRLQGLALLFVCILKLFLYDLRNLEAIYRILSFVALGLILLSVSWIYSRFREHIHRLL